MRINIVNTNCNIDFRLLTIYSQTNLTVKMINNVINVKK